MLYFRCIIYNKLNTSKLFLHILNISKCILFCKFHLNLSKLSFSRLAPEGGKRTLHAMDPSFWERTGREAAKARHSAAGSKEMPEYDE